VLSVEGVHGRLLDDIDPLLDTLLRVAVRRGAEPGAEAARKRVAVEAGLRLQRNGAEIHGFCAAVPEVRIHLPPAESRANFTAIPVGTARSQAVREARPEQLGM
jgi:hypothetical protein